MKYSRSKGTFQLKVKQSVVYGDVSQAKLPALELLDNPCSAVTRQGSGKCVYAFEILGQ